MTLIEHCIFGVFKYTLNQAHVKLMHIACMTMHPLRSNWLNQTTAAILILNPNKSLASIQMHCIAMHIVNAKFRIIVTSNLNSDHVELLKLGFIKWLKHSIQFV